MDVLYSNFKVAKCLTFSSEELVSIEELKDAIKRIQKVPDASLVNRISEVLAKMDIDKDGAIRLDDVLKVSISWCSRNDVQHND
jgi:LETM1 and EF-hand domain-containing protein 1